MSMQGKVAIVTGSNRGIGRGIAMQLAKQGADVVVSYRSHQDEGEAVAAAIRDLGQRAIVCKCDVANRDEIEAMTDRAIEEFGRIDICVANAARTIRKPFLEMTEADVRAVWDVILVGSFNTAQLCAKQMVKQDEGGAILFVSSVHASIPFASCVAYNTGKAGITNMSHTIAEELCKHRIRVNVLEPGWIDTPGERAAFGDGRMEDVGKSLPWGRLGTEEEMGKVAAFLCGDGASYVTGETIRADGGFWLPCRSDDSIEG